MNAILVALGKRLPAYTPSTPQPKAEPLEELVLELTDLNFHEQDGVRRASARARLVYEPATPGQPHVHSAQTWRLIAPIGPIEAGAALVSGEIRRLAEPLFPGSRPQSGGEPRKVGSSSYTTGDARGPQKTS